MLKYLILVLMIFINLSSASAYLPKNDGGQVPWPWGAEIPFPWTEIDGTWIASSLTGQQAIYSLQVVKSPVGERHIKLVQFDVDTCAVMATGAGYEKKKVVRGQMAGKDLKYRFVLSVFKATDLRAKVQSANENIKVISIQPIGFSKAEVYHMELIKVSSDSNYKCSEAKNLLDK